MTLIGHIRRLAEEIPDAPALIEYGEDGSVRTTITREELRKKVEEAAARLFGMGLKAHDRIALDFGNSSELLVVSWAAWSTGIITVPLDVKRDTAELRAYKESVSRTTETLHAGALARAPLGTPEWASGTEHDALILFTSGTTAKPKGALLTLENLSTNARGITQWLGISAQDRFLVQLPLHHINSTTFCLTALLAGASIAITPGYSNSRFWTQDAASGATFTSLVPSIIFDQLSRRKEFEAVRSALKLSRIQLGSAPVVAGAAEEFMRAYGIPLYQGYGQTETALRVTGVPRDLSPEAFARAVAENSIGAPMEWAEVEIMDDDGGILPEGTEGELCVKGPAVMKGYVAGEPAFRDGWFLTGDVGLWKLVEGKRLFYLKGRKKELVIKGGVNISPVAVENALLKISSALDQAYVVGVPDERYGEEVGAFLIWKAGTDEEEALRKLKLTLITGTPHLSAYEVPQHLAHIEAAELPLTSTGKVQRTVLKSNFSDRFEPLRLLFKNAAFRFELIAPQSPLAEASRTLYNHCWQPLTMETAAYKGFLADHYTLGTIDREGVLQGQIAFSPEDKVLTCVSICSAAFKPKPILEAPVVPTLAEVRNYLLEGHDPVMNFHQKLGAALVEVIPNGRPDDKSALGYTMLLAYPPYEGGLDETAPVSFQLVQAARILGRDLGIEVRALSRPGGLAAHLNRA